jgi:hypothetical protein
VAFGFSPPSDMHIPSDTYFGQREARNRDRIHGRSVRGDAGIAIDLRLEHPGCSREDRAVQRSPDPERALGVSDWQFGHISSDVERPRSRTVASAMGAEVRFM